jgi:hypothetical protein
MLEVGITWKRSQKVNPKAEPEAIKMELLSINHRK